MQWYELIGTGVGAVLLNKLGELAVARYTNKSTERIATQDHSLEAWKAILEQNTSDLERKNEELKEQKADLKEQRDLVDKHQQMLMEMQRTISELQLHIIHLESGNMDHPFPWWCKNAEGKMIVVNRAYEQVFLLPRGFTRKDYEQNYDSAIWGDEIAAVYAKNDQRVKTTGQRWEGVEPIATPDGRIENWLIIKYPRYHNGIFLGIAGVAVPGKYYSNEN